MSKLYVMVSLHRTWQVSHVEAGMRMLESCMYKKMAVVKLGNEQKQKQKQTHTRTRAHTHARAHTRSDRCSLTHAHARARTHMLRQVQPHSYTDTHMPATRMRSSSNA